MPVATLYRRIRAKVLSSDQEAYFQAHPKRAQDRDAKKHPEAPASHTSLRDDRHYVNKNTIYTNYSDHNNALGPHTVQIGPPLSNLHLSSGSFANANNTVFQGQVNMYDILLSNPPVLQRLIEKGKPEAIHDSDYREYPPRCSKSTRISLRNDILEWRRNPNRQKRMRWYMGPPAIGKSAIAQSVAEELERSGHLGGSFFFSRPARIDDPATVIPTLAYQLAMKNDLYKQIITRRLADDLLILNKNRSTQFNKLIIEPFQAIAAADSSAIEDPMLIILDGLDECNEAIAQCDIVQLILDHVGRVEKFPLLWLICSRPEWHLRTIVSDVDFPAACEKMEISVDDYEAQADARCLFTVEFAKIKNEYAGYLPEDWPPAEDLDRLCKAASGHLGFVAFMARFIGDAEVADPANQFKVCVRIVSGLGVDQGTRVNPLEALDRLYHRILSDTSPEILPTTMRILRFSAFGYSGHLKIVRDQANFLGLTQTSYDGALKQLHSVVYVPPPSEASSKGLRFYHASFTDFLEDPIRSGKFHLNEGLAYLEVTAQCLRWLSKHGDQPSDMDDPIFEFTRWAGWATGCLVPDSIYPSLVNELVSFDFGILQNPDPGYFAELIRRLYAARTPLNNLLIRLAGEPTETGIRTLALEYKPDSLLFEEWAADFFPEDKSKKTLFSLHFLLGVVTRIHVHLTIVGL